MGSGCRVITGLSLEKGETDRDRERERERERETVLDASAGVICLYWCMCASSCALREGVCVARWCVCACGPACLPPSERPCIMHFAEHVRTHASITDAIAPTSRFNLCGMCGVVVCVCLVSASLHIARSTHTRSRCLAHTPPTDSSFLEAVS